MKMAPLILMVLLLHFITGCSNFLYYPTRGRHVNPEALVHKPSEIVVYEDAAKKEKIVAWHFKAVKESKGTVVVFHGNGQNLSTHFYSMYWVLDKGYDLFIFDYPGYGASLGSPTPQNTVESGWRAIEYVRTHWPQRPYVVVGQSLGGAIALRTVLDMPEPRDLYLCAVVIDSSFLSYKAVGRGALSRSWFTWPLQWMSYLVLSDKYAPGSDIKKLSPVPLMVIHRKGDPVVSAELGQEIFEKALPPKELMLLEGEGHVNAFTASDRVENQQTLLRFLTQSRCQL